MAERSARETALDTLMQITEKGVFLSAALEEALARPDAPAGRNRRLYIRLVEGTLEHLLRIDYHLGQISDTPLRKMKPTVRALLRMSACQILFLDRVPDHAAVSEAVRIAQKRGFGGLKGFVNGVLRSLARQKDTLVLPDAASEPEKYLSVRYSCPDWIVRRWKERYGMQQTEGMLRSFETPRELSLWVNPTRTSADALMGLLAEEGIFVRLHPQLENLLLCSRISNIRENEAFRSGLFYIQDFSSVCAAQLALTELSAGKRDKEKLRIIDVCGAPGGKSLYLASRLGSHAQISCRDISPQKTALITENITRLGMKNVAAQVQDACAFCEKDIGTADLVIADVPCSGLGVIARKADLRGRVTEADAQALQKLQRKILETVSRYVKPDGLLLYSTCTVDVRENEEQAAWIRTQLPFVPVPLHDLPQGLNPETAAEGYLQILPAAEPYHDGFFAALYRRRTETE